MTKLLICTRLSRYKTQNHLPLVCEIVLPRAHSFSIVKYYKTRKYTAKNEDQFVVELNNTDWSELYTSQSSSSKTEVFQNRIMELMDRLLFPLKSYSVRSTDNPWITDHYRKECRKRRVEYRKNGRTERYYRLKRENEEELAVLKKIFYDKECSKMTTPGVISYNALKNINTPTRDKLWSLLRLSRML